MGVTISHRGGPVSEAVVDEIIRQLEDAFKREGLSDVTGIPPTEEERKHGRDKIYWKDDEAAGEHNVGYYEHASKEIADREHFIREYEREAEAPGAFMAGKWSAADEVIPGLGITTREYHRRHAEYGKKHLANLIRRGILIPDDFKPSHVKGICANIDGAETFCVKFVKDDAKDSWRDVGDSTKTQYVKSGPGVHVGFCDFLEDVQKKVQKAGADYEIEDEGEYCDDEEGHKHDPREVVKSVQETAQVINNIGGMLTGQGWTVEENDKKKDPNGGYSPGTLDSWLGADLLITAPKRKGLLLLNSRALSAPAS